MKRKLLLAFCALLIGWSNASAQTDVTTTYITNPSFETDAKDVITPTGWTISGTAGTKKVVDVDSEIGDGYGKVTTLTDGSKGYGIRQAWSATTFSIYQSVTLPAGFYVLKVDEKSVYAAENSSNTPSFKLYADNTESENFAFTTQLGNSTSFFPSYVFSTKSLSFYSDGSEVNIGVSISFMDKRNDVLLDNFKLYSYPAATSSDYAALKEALDAVEGKILGFEVGEYAPYTNKDAIVALANAKAINPSAPNMQSTVQGATAALTSAIWTPNASRMNAFYCGDFSDYVTGDISTNNRAAATGWSNTDTYNCGVVGLRATEPAYGGNDNPGLDGLTSKKALYLRGGFSTAYGSTPGYTVPLKANAIYTLSFTYGGWGQFMENAGTVTVKDGSSTNVLAQSVTTTGTANSDKTKWQSFNAEVKTNDAGSYTVDLNFVAGGQSAFSDFSLLFQNYMVKASATELPAGNMTADTWYYFDIATEGEYKLTASSNLGDIKYVTDGTLAENTPGTAFSVDANNVVSLTVGRYYVKSSSAQSLTVAVYAIATAEDYENLNAAINAAENNIGFEDGEYAPYNNKAMLTTLAEAKAINQSVDNPQATVQGYTTALAAANWTANDGEVNAIRWNIADYPDTGAETKVPTGGFVGSDSGSRISHKSADGGNVGLRGLDQYMALMVISNTNATYGETEGYTLPLKANTIYEFKFKYAGWGECGTPTITILKGSDIIKNVELSTPAKTGNDNQDAWEPASVVFQTNAAGDYKVKFSTSGGRNAFGDLELKKAPATFAVTISGAGYTTFSSAYALDLTTENTPDGLEAYYVTSDGVKDTYVSLTAINQTVAANEGILFKGTAGETYNVPVAASGDALTGNQLVATDGSEVAAGNFVFAYENGTFANPGFYTLTAGTVIAAGKAYLQKPVSGVKAFLPFDGTATGVEAPVAAEAEEEEILYNTAGVRVGKDYKGIVINQKGEKFLNK